jgi:hypothetical protein
MSWVSSSSGCAAIQRTRIRSGAFRATIPAEIRLPVSTTTGRRAVSANELLGLSDLGSRSFKVDNPDAGIF